MALGGQPRSLASSTADGTAFVATNAGISIVKDGQRIAQTKTDFEATSVAISSAGVVAVGGEVRLQAARFYVGDRLRNCLPCAGQQGQAV